MRSYLTKAYGDYIQQLKNTLLKKEIFFYTATVIFIALLIVAVQYGEFSSKGLIAFMMTGVAGSYLMAVGYNHKTIRSWMRRNVCRWFNTVSYDDMLRQLIFKLKDKGETNVLFEDDRIEYVIYTWNKLKEIAVHSPTYKGKQTEHGNPTLTVNQQMFRDAGFRVGFKRYLISRFTDTEIFNDSQKDWFMFWDHAGEKKCVIIDTTNVFHAFSETDKLHIASAALHHHDSKNNVNHTTYCYMPTKDRVRCLEGARKGILSQWVGIYLNKQKGKNKRRRK